MAERIILAATDFSSSAERALRRAADLAPRHGAGLMVVHAIPERGALDRFFGASDGAEAAERSVGERLGAAIEPLSDHGLAVSRSVVRGSAAAAIHAAAVLHDPLLMVVGAHGPGSLRDAIFGTTAERLVERARCPVLVVRRSPRRRYQRILVAVDLDAEASSAATLAAASRLCPEASVSALYVFEALFEMKLLGAHVSAKAVQAHRDESRRRADRRLRAFLAGLGPLGERARPLLRYGQPKDQVLRAAVQTSSDLVAVGRNGSLVSDLFIGSVSKHVLRDAKADVLVVANAPRG